MTPQDPERPKLSAAEIISLSDADFDRLMRKIYPSGESATTEVEVGVEVDVQGWEELSRPDRLKAAQRLRDWIHSVQSRPIDLDQVTARLLEADAALAPPRQAQRSPPSPASTLFGEGAEEYDRKLMVEEETWSYNQLVDDGGRPWYPFHLLGEVAKNPEDHRDMLRFWDSEGGEVYTRQLGRWRKFRTWQRDNREPLDMQAEFEKVWAEHSKEFIEGGRGKLDAEQVREAHFGRISRARRAQHRYSVEHGVSGQDGTARFTTYVSAMRTRLGRHGFERPFQLDQDASRQDKVTTWIEYLNYEYWCHDKFVRQAEKLQPRYEKALKALQDANVLRPGESLDAISSLEYGFKLERESGVAKKAVEVAESAVSAAQKALDTSDTVLYPQGQSPALALTRAQARLNKAVETAKAVEERCELTSNFVTTKRPYEKARDSAEQHKILLQWILDQIPLIEAEVAEAASSGSSSRKRARGDDGEEEMKEVNAKRRKQDSQTSRDAGARPETRATPSQGIPGEGEAAKSSSGLLPKEAPAPGSKPAANGQQSGSKTGGSLPSSDSRLPRRSARIAALQKQKAESSSRPETNSQRTLDTRKAQAPRKRKTNKQQKSNLAKAPGVAESTAKAAKA